VQAPHVKIDLWNGDVLCSLAGILKLQNQCPVRQLWVADGLRKLDNPSGAFCQLLSSVAAGIHGKEHGTRLQ